ncbi:YveK family protein [Mesobacillus harenae]|uniref:YveK family protein n=1 Tax=Mesobacillus harenae TaxID=2213203 RepID=UPI0015812B26|nr:Wzz/FepE/Etk N-terminal domain-containing protein [Mesobacillus harenae]
MRNSQNPDHTKRQLKLDQEIELIYIFRVLKRKVWILLLITALATLAGNFYHSVFHKPVYESSTRLILKTDQDFIKTLQAIIKDPAVLENVIIDLNLTMTVGELAEQITVENIGSSQVVNIMVMNNNPKTAALIANTTASVFKKEVASIINFNDVTVLSKAKEMPKPINSDNFYKTILVAFIGGIIAAIGFVFLLHALDNTLKSENETEELLGLPVLGSVSKINKRNIKRRMKQENIAYRGESIGS